MKKVFVYAICGALLAAGCGTYEGVGAYTGAQFGSILGSAIGGITDGPLGSDVGTIIGMAGGAAVGGAIGHAKDNRNRQEVHDRYQQVQQRKARQQARQQVYDSGFDATNSGDDRLYDFNGPELNGSIGSASGGMAVEVRNAHFYDDNHDGILSRGEMGKVSFEVYNRSGRTLYDIQPVVEAEGNKHVLVSPGIHLESLEPGKGIRYTALVKDDGSLKAGTVRLIASVRQGLDTVSQVIEFNVTTRK